MATIVQQISRNKISPVGLALLIACGSIMMMFAALTSAYIVRQSAGNWAEFALPSLFYWSAGVLIASSLTLQGAYAAFVRNSGVAYRGLLAVTMLLGFSFVLTQYEAWQQMFDSGLYLTGNPATSFVYVLSGLHAAHVLGGIIALIVACIHAFALPVVPTPRRTARMRLTLTYWHFMDFLWIYLLVFFVLQR